MLYERWRQVAHDRGQDLAVVDVPGNRRWSFTQLAAEAETQPPSPGLARPSGVSVDFLRVVLRAWRDGHPVCPLDHGQTLVNALPLPSEVAHCKMTSATTGPPRLVTFTASQLAADADRLVTAMGLRPEWPNLGVISLAHSYGFSNLVLPLLLHGVPLIMAGSPLPESLRRAAADWPDLTLPAVPALWRSWLEAGAIPGKVRLALSAGAPLLPALERAIFNAYGLKVHNFYGATECGGIAYDASLVPRAEDGCVGKPLPGVHLSLALNGCLVVESSSVGLGYFPPDPAHLGHGRYRTCDLAELNSTGVHLKGRSGDLINLAGRKLLPEAVEAALQSHPSVSACLVFGAPDVQTIRQERVVAVVALRPSAMVSESELRHHALQRLPPWQVPREWCWVADIPTNPRGKVSRATWRDRYLAGEIR